MELRRLPGAEIQSPDRVVHVAAPLALMEHDTAFKVVPVQPGEQQRLKIGYRPLHNDHPDLRGGLLEAQHEGVISGRLRDQLPADSIKVPGGSPQDLRRGRALAAGRIHRPGNVTPERRCLNFNDTQMHGEPQGLIGSDASGSAGATSSSILPSATPAKSASKVSRAA